MKRVEVSLEVEPLDEQMVEALKGASVRVYRGNRTWRVAMMVAVAGTQSVRAQAYDAVVSLVRSHQLPATTDPPSYSLRDPDTILDTKGTDLLLHETERSYDPDPRPRPKRKWYQVAMELGLGERKV